MGDVASLNCVYLLAPCRENLPINCILILSVKFPRVFFFSCIETTPSPGLWWIYDPLFTLHSCLSCSYSLLIPSNGCFYVCAKKCKHKYSVLRVHTYTEVQYAIINKWMGGWMDKWIYTDTCPLLQWHAAVVVKATKKLQWWKTSQSCWEAIFCFMPAEIYGSGLGISGLSDPPTVRDSLAYKWCIPEVSILTFFSKLIK